MSQTGKRTTVFKAIRKTLLGSTKVTQWEEDSVISPFYSTTSFVDMSLDRKLVQGICDMGYARPSRVQEVLLPEILNNPTEHYLLQSEPGTGKTAVYGLSVLNRINTETLYPQAVIVCSTRISAIQTAQMIRSMAKHRPDIRIGLLSSEKYCETTSNHIIVCTLGKLYNVAYLHKLFDFSKLHMLVWDDFGCTFESPDNFLLCARLLNLASVSQKIFICTTMTNSMLELMENLLPTMTVCRSWNQIMPNVLSFFIKEKDKSMKFGKLVEILRESSRCGGTVVVFVDTNQEAADITSHLNHMNLDASVLTSDFPLFEQEQTIDSFRNGSKKILVTTDLLSYGIDVEGLRVIINYTLPVSRDGTTPDRNTYIQRMGRCGRFGTIGICITFVDQ